MQRKSLEPEAGPGQAADLRRMKRAHPTLLEDAVTMGRSLTLIISLAGAFSVVGASMANPSLAQVSSEGEAYRGTDLRTARYVRAVVVHSLEETFIRATNKNLGPALAQVVKRIVVWWINPRRELFKGDVIEVVYKTQVDGEPIVLAVWMYSQKRRKNLSAVRYRAAKSKFYRYYTPDGREVERRLKNSPVKHYEQITSLLGDGRRHMGIDFKAPIGTPVYAPFSGVVRRRNWSTRRNGRCLELRDPRTGRRAIFLHLNRIYRRIRPGVRVRVGQKIATLGNTGRSSAPHLHYQLERANGRVLNPLRVHRTWRARLAPADRKKARQVLKRLAEMRTRST